jgi:class 3 adenylate cyclase
MISSPSLSLDPHSCDKAFRALGWPGGICASRVVRDQVRDKLDFLFADIGEQQVKNIA